jgi:hypothetical protein
MKPREHYEKIANETMILSGEAKAARLNLDVLLDIRDLLMRAEHREMVEEARKAREAITVVRVNRTI